MSAHINQQINNLSYALRQQQQALGELHQKIDAVNSLPASNASQPRTPTSIDDIPGLRTPKWYVVEIDYTKGDTSVRFNSAEIAPDGPFIITQAAPWWKITDATASDFYGSPTNPPTGRTLPCTAAPFLLNSGITNIDAFQGGSQSGNTLGIGDLFDSSGTIGALSDIPEFSFQIEIAGSGRFWTNTKVPAADFYGWGGQPNYFGIQGWVERMDRITVHASPEVAIPHDGTVRFSFCGYQILGPINISEALNVPS